MIEEWKTIIRLWTEPLRDMSLSYWPSFIQVIQLIQEVVLNGACSTIELQHLHDFYLGILEPVKESSFAYLRADALHSH